ncbi:cytochrome c biogenesis protein CcdA [Candidatus Aminicenantes bacterium AC-335-A11]|jgi:cytochrome c-type biogenesis protein|nr:cytochrome c biogenesis protein CcdA [SCandidatus Aminicenantes bacterium Aminicenantia_JdfR_composite]MCP2596413.1 cytochrome c biogenesis protein CcdA [Candidatus Aminicenantes bacterium AC-335-G13]MCP2606192.1 cytochrome c biogenesis protein CcdA [Candidatus Aminicenantes bacterium AC-708-I09]MCP2618209.1 cytochrome c biogenesis protein CcdA [Candidatus Aminicenantes bacterium AC-335-A11]
MSGAENISLLVSFGAGFLSFISPCILPLIPSYLAFITGVSIEELTDGNYKSARLGVILNSLLFIFGFSLVFIAFGASATLIGKILLQNKRIIEIIGGIIIIILGIHFTGLIKFRFLEKEKSIHISKKPLGYLGSFLVGAAFAAGWTPCIGPILASILTLAASTQNIGKGILMLAFYSLGLGIPFFITGLLLHKFFEYFKTIRKHFKTITIIGGIFLILIGIILLSGTFSLINAYINRIL